MVIFIKNKAHDYVLVKDADRSAADRIIRLFVVSAL